MTAGPRASVIVITRNRARLLADCLDALLAQQTPFAFEIVVVDDGSTDATPQVAADRAPRGVRHAPQPHGGVNAARNRGIAEARGGILVFVDDDELAPEGYLARAVERLERSEGYDGVGGPCRDNGSGVRTCPGCSLSAVDLPGKGLREVPRLLGGNMAVWARVFGDVGPFHAALSGRGDDNEWFTRAQARGLRFLQDPDLWVWHRRDHFSLLALCRQAFRQGTTIPLAAALQGAPYRPAWGRIPRGLAHALLNRCAKGLWLASREAGAILGALRLAGRPGRTAS